MPGRLGIDFGTSNTVVAVWDEARKEGVPLHVPDYGRQLQYRRGDRGTESISLIPSLIHYAAGNRRWIGQQVFSHDLAHPARTFRLIDEPSAAALGYGAHVQPGQVYLIFDFGGGTLDVAVVLIEDTASESGEPGRRCRVLGKAGADVGGMSIDQWLFQEVLSRCG